MDMNGTGYEFGRSSASVPGSHYFLIRRYDMSGPGSEDGKGHGTLSYSPGGWGGGSGGIADISLPFL